jgi:hypothetical protein
MPILDEDNQRWMCLGFSGSVRNNPVAKIHHDRNEPNHSPLDQENTGNTPCGSPPDWGPFPSPGTNAAGVAWCRTILRPPFSVHFLSREASRTHSVGMFGR